MIEQTKRERIMSGIILFALLGGCLLDMPFLLILFGVLGGALAFGFISVFLGPVLLAIVYRIIAKWTIETEPITPGKV